MDRLAFAPILTVDAVRAAERRHGTHGLMARAGAAAAGVAATLADPRGGTVVVLAGPGNNGGDGFVVARELKARYFDVAVVFRGDTSKLPVDARDAHAAWIAAGGSTRTDPPGARAALVIDALFGIGVGRPIDAPYAELVDWANAIDAPVLALDLPSGLDADRGIATGPVVHANATATFIALKPGLLTAEGPDLAGDVSVHALDVDAGAAAGRRIDWATLAPMLASSLRRRRRNVHKGTFGTVAIVGGAHGMIGAPILAARAAAGAGAGKTRIGFVGVPHPLFDPMAPELMLGEVAQSLDGATAVVAGPGLGQSDASANALRRALDAPVPLVLDADALNLAAASNSLRESIAARTAPTIVTPHPAEAARLLGIPTKEVERDRIVAALALVDALRTHVVLKGAGSVLAHPGGDWAINASGNPALATAGSGDVLAGLVGALLAQGLAAADALMAGVCLHGAAADTLVARGIGPIGIASGELTDAARALLNQGSESGL